MFYKKLVRLLNYKKLMTISEKTIRKIIKEEIIREDARRQIFGDIAVSVKHMWKAAGDIKKHYGPITEYKQLVKLAKGVEQWYKHWK